MYKFRVAVCIERKKSARLPTKETADAVNETRKRTQQSPGTLVKELILEIGIWHGSAHKTVKKELGMFPYKVSEIKELKHPDYISKLHYCHWFQW